MKLYKPVRHKAASGRGYEGGDAPHATPLASPYEPGYLSIKQFPDKRFWIIGIFATLRGASEEVIEELRTDGWEPWSEQTKAVFSFLETHFAQTLIVEEYDYGFRYWARTPALLFAQRYPVLLTHQTDEKEYAHLVPPDMVVGSAALIFEGDSYFLYTIEQLGEQGQDLSVQIKAGMLLFPDDADPSEHDRRRQEAARREAWEPTQQAAQHLAKLYWELHQQRTKSSPRTHGLPALTSAHRTRLPLTNSFRGLAQSFGPAVQHSIWNQQLEGTLELLTPNGTLLRVVGTNTAENVALHRYVTQMLGPEGLKHLIILLDAYYLQTKGTDRKADARVSLRQLLIRLGAGSKADDREEQRKFMHSILYLASTYITSDERQPPETRPQPLARQRRRRKTDRKDYSPLLIIERLKPSPDGSIQIPDEVEYHLGAEFFEALFGPQQQFFSLPTALLLRYHAVREQQELLLAFYLSNALITSGGRFSASFLTLVLQSALQSQDEVARGHDRLRDARRVLFALEHLEQQDLIRRESHIAIDTALTMELATKKEIQEMLAPATLQRIQLEVTYQQQLPPEKIRASRRIALQQLLDEHTHPPVTFLAGPVLVDQIQHHQQRLHEQKNTPAQLPPSTPPRKRRKKDVL
ncbi:MAG: hypothetical protein H0V70_30450 [Ktedonobacteraceae bacterium]|nr:hypothetical protein [Ktedonobacteraceae bacterium]